jgi:hypothetical protein
LNSELELINYYNKNQQINHDPKITNKLINMCECSVDCKRVDPALLEIFGESVCSVCELKTSDYDLISKSEVQLGILIIPF